MDAQENKRIVMEGYQMYRNGDVQGLLACYDEQAVWIEPDVENVSPAVAGKHVGKMEIARYFEQLGECIQTLRFEPHDFIAEGDKVVVTGEATWQAKNTGRSYDTPWVHVFTLRDGKIVRLQSYHDTAAGERAFRPDQPGQAPATGAPLHH